MHTFLLYVVESKNFQNIFPKQVLHVYVLTTICMHIFYLFTLLFHFTPLRISYAA